MKKNKKLVLTGGGTAGHVIPHIPMLEDYRRRRWDLLYIGSKGIERHLMEEQLVPFETISSGKLRRYWSWHNAKDLFKVAWGCLQSLVILLRFRPHLVFSKGGFVSVPVCLAAWVLRIPVVTHESDLSPGLATRIIARFARKVLVSFPASVKRFRPGLAVHVGSPVRPELMTGNRQKALSFLDWEETPQPVLLVMGGSLGAERLNQSLIRVAKSLLEKTRIIHITGRGKATPFQAPGYKQFEFVGPELGDIFALSDFVISRAGANSIFELLALDKPSLLIPLEQGSRGDQVENAMEFEKQGFALMLRESHLTDDVLLSKWEELVQKKDTLIQRMKAADPGPVAQKIVGVLETL